MIRSMRTEAPLVDAIWPADVRPFWRAAAVAVAGSALLWLSAKVQVPMWPVPMTMQSFVVLMIGATCGLRLGLATIGLYVAQGALGLPVFAGPAAGPLYLVGPTGGYLAGFVAAIAAMGWLAERGWLADARRRLALLALGTAIPLGLGWAWLATLVGPGRALAVGVTPFLLGGALKLALAAALLAFAPRARASG